MYQVFFTFRLFLVIFLIFFYSEIKGQKSIDEYNYLYFNNIGLNEGLPSLICNSAVQDIHGFVWLGTENGLCRLDAYKSLFFRTKNTETSLSNNRITCMLNDKNYIWIGTWDGLNVINTKTLEIKQISICKTKVIRSLYKDHSGNIWIGTNEGVLKYEKKADKYVAYNTSNSKLSHNTIRAFFQTNNGDMYIGTYNKLNRLRNSKIEVFDLKRNYKPFISNNLICSISPVSPLSDSCLWIGTETGLCLFNTRNGEYKNFNTSNTELSNEVIKCIYPESDSILWLGTDYGLTIFNTFTHKTNCYTHNPLINFSISNNVIWQIFKDKNNVLWLCTSGGISLIDNSHNFYKLSNNFEQKNNNLSAEQIKDILIDKEQNIWLATLKGIVFSDTKKKSSEIWSTKNKNLLLDNTFAVYQDNLQRIWIGTAGGINVWDKNLKKMYSFSSNINTGLKSNYINGFHQQDNGTMWVTAWEGGLFKLSGDWKNLENIRFNIIDKEGDGKLISYKNRIFYALKKDFWEIDTSTYEKRRIAIVGNLLENHEISAVYCDSKKNTIWIAAETILIKYNLLTSEAKLVELSKTNQKSILNIISDQQDNLWLTTANSIIKLEIANMQSVLIPLNPSSPLKSFYPNSCTRDAANNIYFGGDYGFLYINPKNVQINEMYPSIKITELLINNQSVISDTSINNGMPVTYSKIISLKNHQNSFVFEFSALDYLQPTDCYYTYRLLNYNDEWQFTSGDKNFAVFSNLTPGEYIFEVKSCNHFGIWSKETARLKLCISPPLWQRTPFIILYLALTVLAIYFGLRLYSHRQKLNNELKFVKLEKQHAEDIFRMKQQFFTNISHEFRTPLSLIGPPLQQVLNSQLEDEKNTKMVELAAKNSKRLLKLVNQLLDFRKLELSQLQLVNNNFDLINLISEVYNSFTDLALRNEIKYTFTSNVQKLVITADYDKLETLFFNILSNAFKFTPHSGNISVEAEFFSKNNNENTLQQIIIKVSDNGIGISDEDKPRIFERFYQSTDTQKHKAGSGIGLTLALEFARLHNGNIEVESSINSCTCFLIKLPVGNIPEDAIVQIDKTVITTENNLKKAGYTKKTYETKNKTMLIVDDNEDILDYIEINFNTEYRIIRASDGLKALEKLQKKKPDIIISDIMMPNCDGLELCTKVKENPASAHIPLILLTAQNQDLQKINGLKSGADMYVSKPFDIDYLNYCIISLFRREEQLLQFIRREIITNTPEYTNPDNNQDEIFLRNVMKIIEQNTSNPDLSVEMISEKMNLSTTHLYRKLKNITNLATKDIIKNYRMEKAARMLANNEGNISEIMYAVGFSSLSSFSKSFKAKFGTSPSTYK